MTRELLGIVCSPRRFGNSELFVKELYRQLKGDWDLTLMRLPELDIRPCKACYQCLFGEMRCIQDDDFHAALQALVDCDAYVVAAPTYLLGPNASLKRFLDRGLAFYAHAERLWRKPAVGVAIAGIRELEGYTGLALESFIRLTFADLRGTDVLYGALPGEIFLESEGRLAAQRLAGAITDGGEEKDPEIPRCPLCGGDTFRFFGDGRVRCMLCSSSGHYRATSEGLEIHTVPGEHPLFFTCEDVARHTRWLRGMKERFLERRNELKEITRHYTQTGTWIRSKKTVERGGIE
ncbi:MAG TPA: flavodoxin family protein [Syntrophobacteraceae bacterium]|nr:flavodoxin family protein [Syntrophobacteraceae bacterium]